MKKMFLAILIVGQLGCTSFPSLPSEPVLDMAHMLSDSEKATLANRVQKLMDDTSMHIRLVTVDDVSPYKTASDYTVDLYHSWQLGDPNKHNGLLILIARHIGSDSRDMKDYCRIMTGHGIVPILPDAVVVGNIKHLYLMPHLPNEPFLAFDSTLTRVTEEIAKWKQTHPGDSTVQASNDDMASIVAFCIIVGVVLLVVIIVFFVMSSSGGGYYSGGGTSGGDSGGCSTSSCGGGGGCGGGGCSG